jgi:DNA-binding NarL/FixJ family response regulator
MDLQMPGMSGEEAIRAIAGEFPGARIIVLTNYSGDAQVIRAMKLGASAYLLKNMLRTDLLNTIRQLHEGKRYFPSEVAGIIAAHMMDDALTCREIEVLRLVAQGFSNKEIANRIHVSEETTKSHVSNILSKLGARDRTQAVVIAARRGIIDILDGAIDGLS